MAGLFQAAIQEVIAKAEGVLAGRITRPSHSEERLGRPGRRPGKRIQAHGLQRGQPSGRMDHQGRLIGSLLAQRLG